MHFRSTLTLIEQFGFTNAQARLFYVGLTNPPLLMSHLAKKSKISRGSAYYMMEELVRRGYFSIHKKGKRTYYKAVSPEQLLKMVRKRERLVQRILREILS